MLPNEMVEPQKVNMIASLFSLAWTKQAGVLEDL